MPVNKANMKKWVVALRSGKYRQGGGHLRPTKNSYCCLGVVCDVYKEETGDGKWVKDGLGSKYAFAVQEKDSWGEYFDDNFDLSMPGKVSKWLGIKTDDPQLTRADGGLSASALNDEIVKNKHKYKFPDIADLVENKYIKGK